MGVQVSRTDILRRRRKREENNREDEMREVCGLDIGKQEIERGDHG